MLVNIGIYRSAAGTSAMKMSVCLHSQYSSIGDIYSIDEFKRIILNPVVDLDEPALVFIPRRVCVGEWLFISGSLFHSFARCDDSDRFLLLYKCIESPSTTLLFCIALVDPPTEKKSSRLPFLTNCFTSPYLFFSWFAIEKKRRQKNHLSLSAPIYHDSVASQ